MLNKQLFFILAISFGISYLLTPLVRKLSTKLNILDVPDKRKLHRRPTPTIGGLAFFIAFNITVLIAKKLNPDFSSQIAPYLTALIVGGVIILFFGIIHDVRNISPAVKLVGQIIVASITFAYGLKIEFITNPFGGQIQLNIALSLILTIGWMVIMMNAINLIDGLDGLAAGLVAISAFSLFFIAMSRQDVISVFLTVILFGSLLGFLRFNFYPAKIFMGDTGSMFLGFILSVISIGGINKMAITVALLVPIATLIVPMYDTLFAIVRRIVSKTDIFKADRKHIHYRLLDMGVGHREVVLLLYFVSSYFAIISFLFILIPTEFAFILLLLMLMGVFMGIKALDFIEKKFDKPR